MKVLILSVTAGEGHNSTAAAIRDSLVARGAECEILDTCLRINRALYSIISRGYLVTTKNFKRLYASVYTHLEKRRSNSFTASATRTSYGMIFRRVYKYIQEYRPDVIVYTHVFAGTLLDVIKQKKQLCTPSVGILTDFVMHPFWEESLRTDRVVIPNELLIPAAERKGLRRDQIAPIGIPIRPGFADSVPKEEARARLGLAPDKHTLLLMGGSMGYGSIAKTLVEIDALEEDLQIVVVCGNNKKAKAEIDGMSFRKRVLSLGYTKEIPLLMDAADCIVSKPGGLTTSEALAKRLPMIIVNPIPGQEDRNAEFLLNCGAAMRVGLGTRLSDAVYQLFHHPGRLELMQRSIDMIRKPNSTRDLTDMILSLGSRADAALPAATR